MTHSDTCQHAPTPPTPPNPADPADPTQPGKPLQHEMIYLRLEARTAIAQSTNERQSDIDWKVAVASMTGILQQHLSAIQSANGTRCMHAAGVIGNAEQPRTLTFMVDLDTLDPEEEEEGEMEGESATA